ncbi:hypothetical protein O3Q52_36160 [Streptomyces sp. ActVer]|uniref:hypothetical protein n=1 Tax=Streptomyces sp. ActVer TaxID=3014558 RepID=UPI0022B39AA0|nr:hypothetical protein [Streptomyces sp. ActVer]MCZ4513489.1 hypothetical protein [Streptomyces sp. ActVer]
MNLRDFARSLLPGNDQALAADMRADTSRRNRAGHRRSGAARAARQGQAWDDADRDRERTGRRRKRT